MIPEKIEDAHNFKRMLNNDNGLSTFQAQNIHESYESFINKNYVLKAEKSHMDHILNKPNSQV